MKPTEIGSHLSHSRRGGYSRQETAAQHWAGSPAAHWFHTHFVLTSARLQGTTALSTALTGQTSCCSCFKLTNSLREHTDSHTHEAKRRSLFALVRNLRNGPHTNLYGMHGGSDRLLQDAFFCVFRFSPFSLSQIGVRWQPWPTWEYMSHFLLPQSHFSHSTSHETKTTAHIQVYKLF